MDFFKIERRGDDLVVNTKEWKPNLEKDVDEGIIQKYYLLKVNNLFTLTDKIDCKNVIIHGLSENIEFIYEYIPISETETHKMTFLKVKNDLYGKHLSFILNLLLSKDLDIETSTDLLYYRICVPDHFEVYDKQKNIIASTETLDKLLNDLNNYSLKKSSIMLTLGLSYDEEFKNPVRILGLTQLLLFRH